MPVPEYGYAYRIPIYRNRREELVRVARAFTTYNNPNLTYPTPNSNPNLTITNPKLTLLIRPGRVVGLRAGRLLDQTRHQNLPWKRRAELLSFRRSRHNRSGCVMQHCSSSSHWKNKVCCHTVTFPIQTNHSLS